jgi:hypothetical protein
MLFAMLLATLLAVPPLTAAPSGFSHGFHAGELSLDCTICHVPDKPGSVMLRRPGHEPCRICHVDAFTGRDPSRSICQQCHASPSSPGVADLMVFPRASAAILRDFSHVLHADKLNRKDTRTGFRADCTFCHALDPQGILATLPKHTECAACHSKAGIRPALNTSMNTSDCRGCHAPEETESRSPAVYVNLRFSHAAHFIHREQFRLDCTTCHAEMPRSTTRSMQALPAMIDCVGCHDTNKTMPAAFRMSNCQTCHIEQKSGAVPTSHSRDAKPPSHTETFRRRHEEEASSPGAKCFVCHVNQQPSASAKDQCTACHQAMRPASHTVRWRDDLHGHYAAMDRVSCATCHTADTCSRCHNELPASHVPLALFKGGAHARPAMLNERSCLTCHTFQNTCSECHTRTAK